ncbi:MAG TPA: hypothetical protein VLE23_19735 [Geminicoccaceae bacterium]|nr:hypothetical protein [Geminicoccaceae bacterium]
MWFAAAVLTIAPSAVGAVCAPADLAGGWDAYAIGVDDEGPFWERCNIRFSAAARILSGSFCVDDTGARSTLSGRLIVRSNCRMVGSFTQQFSGGSSNCSFSQATLSLDKEVASGVGKCDGGASIFAFDMIQR